jgi:hypothetical protein
MVQLRILGATYIGLCLSCHGFYMNQEVLVVVYVLYYTVQAQQDTVLILIVIFQTLYCIMHIYR